MITRIPRLTGAATTAQVNTVIETIERELNNRPETADGYIMVSDEQPLVLQAPNGSLHRVIVANDGSLSTTPSRNRRVDP